MTRLRIATRGSDLALAQARFVAERLGEALGAESELVVVRTTGDRIRDVPLAKIGGKGLFVKEIEEALFDGRADLAVHSAKDLPAERPDGLVLAAWPERADARDALVAREPGATLTSLPRGARVGTGSVRRRAQILAARPDLEVVGLRGNVPTRIGKVDAGALDAVVLACAGLDRLALGGRIGERVAPELLLPAVCQGTLAVETRAGSELEGRLAGALDRAEVALAAAAERGFLVGIGGDCSTPLAAFAERVAGDRLRLRALVADPTGARIVRGETECDATAEAGDAAGRALAEKLLAQGARALLAEAAP